MATSASLSLIKFLSAKTQRSPNCVECPRGKVPISVSWNGGVTVIGHVNPDFVGTSRLAV